MDEGLIYVLVCLGFGACVLVLMWGLGTRVGKTTCSKCGHVVQVHEIGTELIPGTEERIERESDPYYGPDARPRRYESRLYAEYRVFCRCPDCEYEWERTDKRQVPEAKVEYRMR